MDAFCSCSTVDHLREEIGVQVLGWLVRQARTSPFLSPLPPHDLLLLLTRAWPQLLLLHAAYWPLDLLLLLQNEIKVDKPAPKDGMLVRTQLTCLSSIYRVSGTLVQNF